MLCFSSSQIKEKSDIGGRMVCGHAIKECLSAPKGPTQGITGNLHLWASQSFEALNWQTKIYTGFL